MGYDGLNGAVALTGKQAAPPELAVPLRKGIWRAGRAPHIGENANN